MNLITRKHKIRLGQFCEDFYSRNLLYPIIQGINAGAIFLDTIRQSIVNADPSFGDIDEALFSDELTALRFEMFGLAGFTNSEISALRNKVSSPRATLEIMRGWTSGKQCNHITKQYRVLAHTDVRKRQDLDERVSFSSREFEWICLRNGMMKASMRIVSLAQQIGCVRKTLGKRASHALTS